MSPREAATSGSSLHVALSRGDMSPREAATSGSSLHVALSSRDMSPREAATSGSSLHVALSGRDMSPREAATSGSSLHVALSRGDMSPREAATSGSSLHVALSGRDMSPREVATSSSSLHFALSGRDMSLNKRFAAHQREIQAMLCCTDVAYGTDKDGTNLAVAAAVFFSQWNDPAASEQRTVESRNFGAYRPGEFYRRELPVLLDLLSEHRSQLQTIIVDGYVWLGPDRPGLGKHLYDAFDRQIPVIGVAKSSFHGNSEARSVIRGNSLKPLWVTAAGLAVDEAARLVDGMHGSYRLPTLLKAVDRLGREQLESRSKAQLKEHQEGN